MLSPFFLRGVLNSPILHPFVGTTKPVLNDQDIEAQVEHYVDRNISPPILKRKGWWWRRQTKRVLKTGQLKKVFHMLNNDLQGTYKDDVQRKKKAKEFLEDAIVEKWGLRLKIPAYE